MDSLDSVTKPEPGAEVGPPPEPERKLDAKRIAIVLAEAVLVSVACAFAVHLGFRAGFVSAVVAWGTSAYMVTLVVMLVGRDGENPHLAHRSWVRIPLSVSISACCLWLLRGPLLFELPVQTFTTTGHSPFVVFPVSALLSAVALMLLERFVGRPARG